MGFVNKYLKVMRADLTVSLLISLASIFCLISATVCPPGEKYWNPEQEVCKNCTRCDLIGHVVLRPCEVHRDTVCGPLSELEIDWSWLNKHHKRHYGKKHRNNDQKATSSNSEESIKDINEVTSTEMAFTTTDSLVWDWQAVALTLAVFACLLFFFVAALYSIYQARQWKILKDNFEADVEELSARLNLMVTSGELNENLEPNTAPVTDGNYLSNHCVYLEQLLVRKDSKIGPGNVYIEESNTNTLSKTS